MNTFLLFIVLVGLGNAVQQQGSDRDLRLVVISNGVAILPCGSTEWRKNNYPVPTDNRVQITQEGHLLIKDAREEDSGLYVCKTQKDGQVTEINVTLIVLVSDTAPYFFNFTQPNKSIQENVGSNVTFQCPARGHPTPGITWLKNGIHIDTSNLDSTTDYMKWSITLQNLQVRDSGTYTCIIANELGSVNASFHLVVRQPTNQSSTSRPDLSVFHPLNTTVKFGSSATFQCRVRSEAPPNIQWLKKVEDRDLLKWKEEGHEMMKVQGENYRVLLSSEVTEKPDGSFLNKLVISEVTEADSGKYICLGANSMGYSYRSAYLSVLQRPRALPLGWSRGVHQPSSLLVAIPVTLGVLVGLMVSLVIMCHKRKGPMPPDAHLAHSEVELEGSGHVVTRLRLEPTTEV